MICSQLKLQMILIYVFMPMYYYLPKYTSCCLNLKLILSELSNPLRYHGDIPISVLPSMAQIDTPNGTNISTSSTIGADLPSTEKLETTLNTTDNNNNPVEFFISSDGSAILEHTNRVIYLEV